MLLKEITNYLESLAPLSTQESYDNSGYICGDKNWEITNALITLDCIEATIDEAIEKKCNLIIAHHPIVFKGLKSITGKNYIERTVIKAIKNNIAIYAIHTNLDNYAKGVNYKIGQLLGITNPKILAPTYGNLEKLATYVPMAHQETVLNALYTAGAGKIGAYSECSFTLEGDGSFKANDSAQPFVGEIGKRQLEKEIKIEVIINKSQRNQIIVALLQAHPYESVAYDIFTLNNANTEIGAGMYGSLDKPVDTLEFFDQLKKTFKCQVIRHTDILQKTVQKIAWCGGSGSFLLAQAKNVKADIYITGDFKYHEFFDAEQDIIIADIGHYESEQFTIELIHDILSENFIKFAPYLTERVTNPVKYY
ncbi:Nif3-like dinuclear metal center hexameric protein [Putridiphycobacter roseus]|uniref:GTP cyclohydrolase 1 type 2 homolog n=1 Tax=Putridiphycobacter roseus TaxID=2219161 RepID=A0A2W1MV93_9FLAO|nr:Nif3-like dinuclear metal center hexameric protein [Putridiphycobacter roseus]PZE15737.1 Nif3-like dinuclear metal center hexameric protein [Putridiphycobacter roseus]